MAQDKIIELRRFLFDYIFYYKDYDKTDTDLATLFGSIVSVNVDTKADKFADGIENNFMCFDDEGNIKDSLVNADSFADASHVHDGRYLRLDDDNLYDTTLNGGQTFTWGVQDGVPFVIDNASGDPLPVVEHLNADKLDDYDADAFALADHTHDSRYILANTATNVTNLLTFTRQGSSVAPFAVHSTNTGVVTYLNADKLDGYNGSDFALVAHAHDSRYLRLDDDNTYDAVGNTFTFTVDDGAPFVIDNTSGDPLAVVTHFNSDKLDGYDADDFALVGHNHNSAYPALVDGSVEDNFVSFNDDQGQLKDSGVSASDFAAAGHNHDSDYLNIPSAGSGGTATLLTTDGTSAFNSAITEDKVVTSSKSTGATTTANGTLAVVVDGTTYYLLKAAAA